jgi:hypothetical protein
MYRNIETLEEIEGSILLPMPTGKQKGSKIEYSGAWSHITSRGNERREIFKGDADRQKFFKILASSMALYNARSGNMGMPDQEQGGAKKNSSGLSWCQKSRGQLSG